MSNVEYFPAIRSDGSLNPAVAAATIRTSIGLGDVLSSPLRLIITRTTAPEGFTGGSGVWTGNLPSWVRFVEARIICGGQGGGSGRRGAAGTNRFGGGGGPGAVGTIVQLGPISPSASCVVNVGAGGAGGASVASDNTDGNNGSTGGQSSIDVDGLLHAVLGVNFTTTGRGGTAASGPVSAVPSNNLMISIPGSASSISGVPDHVPFQPLSIWGGVGGCGGGGIDSSNIARAGSGFNAATNFSAVIALHGTLRFGGSAGGGAGNSAASPNNLSSLTGYVGNWGGSGGGGNAAGAGGNGGDGSFPGGGGGGGGASVNGFNSGAGGNGGDGMVSLLCW